MFIRSFIFSFLISLTFLSVSCHRVTPSDLKTQLEIANPKWDGTFYAGYYANKTPVFEFTDGPEINAVALSGKNLNNFRPLKDICLRILCLRKCEITSLDFLSTLNWEPEAIVELQNCKKIVNYRGLKNLPLTVINISNTPFFDTTLLGSKLLSVYLEHTNVKKLDFAKPEIIEDLIFIKKPGGPDADIRQISEMKRLVHLQLKNIKNLNGINFTSLQYLQSLSLSHIDSVRFPKLAHSVISSIWIEDCPDLTIGETLNNKFIDRLCLMRCGDPGKLLAQIANTKINVLVINGAHISNFSFLKRIKDLKHVRFQNCTGLPEKLNLPFVEVVIE